MAEERYGRERESDRDRSASRGPRTRERGDGHDDGGERVEGGQGRGTYQGQESGGEPYGGGEQFGRRQSGGWQGGEPYGGGEQFGRRQSGGWQGGEPYGGGEQFGRRQSGGFAGRGPKGYRRSDDRIQEDLSEELTQDAGIDPGDIEITVQAGEITLKGTVDSRHTKRQVEDIAEQISGVRQVHNQLRVRSGTETESAPASSQASGTSGSMGSSRARETESRGSKT